MIEEGSPNEEQKDCHLSTSKMPQRIASPPISNSQNSEFWKPIAESHNTKDVEAAMAEAEFHPRLIHERRHYWGQDLQASPWVMQLIDNGYSIPFEKIPGSYVDKNNKSARENMEFVRQQVHEWHSLGLICKKL